MMILTMKWLQCIKCPLEGERFFLLILRQRKRLHNSHKNPEKFNFYQLYSLYGIKLHKDFPIALFHYEKKEEEIQWLLKLSFYYIFEEGRGIE